MPLIDHVTLQITSDSVGISRKGFGVPGILSYNAAFPERVRFYQSLSGVTDDFSTTDVEYLTAAAIFSQNPKPERIAILRGALAPTQNYTITPTAVDSTEYKITVVAEGGVSEEVTFTSDASALVSEITAGLETALNAVVSRNFTATDNTTDLSVVGDAAGNWFSLKVEDPTLLKIEQVHADPGIATDLAAIKLASDDWYCLLTNYNSNAMVLAAAGWIETEKKIYLVDVNETDAINTAAGNSDTLDDLEVASRARTGGCYHPSPAEFLAASWAGKVLPRDPGSVTWKFKSLSGPAATSLTTTQRANLIARNANLYERVAGLDIMSEGTMADGEFIDTVRGLDKVDDDVRKSVFETLGGAPKIPYTDAGVGAIKGAVKGALDRAVAEGILDGATPPVVTAPLVADVATADKVARVLPDVKFTARLAGAIHKVEIEGVVSV